MKNNKSRSIGSLCHSCSGVLRAVLCGLLLSGSTLSFGNYMDDIGFTRLATELAHGLPDGVGVNVFQVEADENRDSPDLITLYSPNPVNSQFIGKTITDITATSTDYSGHATSVGSIFYGNTQSIAPGITSIGSYNAFDWLKSGFVNASEFDRGPEPQPQSTSSRIANHSWVGTFLNMTFISDILHRIDWIIERDEFIQVAAVNNGGTPNALLSSAYNTVSVGRTDAGHALGTVGVDREYKANRTAPDIVAPAGTTSSATPMVSSATALLIETGHSNPDLSTDPVQRATTNRNGDTIYNAERSEVIKAALMAGAERSTNNTAAADITDYRVDIAMQTANGLDKRFGAGQLSVFNSYHIIAAGEQNSIDDAPSGGGLIGNRGFDYDPSFGGENGGNAEASYYFSTGLENARLVASLVWNINIDGGSSTDFNGAATLFDMDLFLYDITNAASEFDWEKLASSESLVENTENLWMMLESNRNYAMQVKRGIGQAAFDWDYALAWQITAVPVPAAVWLFSSGLLGLMGIAGRFRTVSEVSKPLI